MSKIITHRLWCIKKIQMVYIDTYRCALRSRLQKAFKLKVNRIHSMEPRLLLFGIFIGK